MFLESIDSHLRQIQNALSADVEYKASTKDATVRFDLKVDGKDDHLTIDIVNGGTRIYSYSYSTSNPTFTLLARQEQWAELFQPVPEPPFQSFWGMLRTLGRENGIRILGDSIAFTKHARTWRLLLDITRAVVNKAFTPAQTISPSDTDPEEHITGRYIHTTTPLHGHTRIFTESSGHGSQEILFLHTAGSDSRQYHALMNTPSLQARFTMHAFDLPSHGRSSLGSAQIITDLSLDEETYISTIRQVIQKLSLTDLIVCGASMAGQICLALALHAAEIGIKGVIPCEACAHIPKSPPIYMYSGLDESVLNPETVCGMMSPTSPEMHKRQVWWGYSSQGINVFKGDLKFYFQGWDGRGRMKDIACPVYMLTGSYDYSCTPAMSRATFEEIKSGRVKELVAFEVMDSMGHFPASENPERFVEFFLTAVDFIEEKSMKKRR